MAWVLHLQRALVLAAVAAARSTIDNAGTVRTLRNGCALVLSLVDASLVIGRTNRAPTHTARLEHSLQKAKVHLTHIVSGRVAGSYAYHARFLVTSLESAMQAVNGGA